MPAKKTPAEKTTAKAAPDEPLAEYRRKRSADKTPEPVPAKSSRSTKGADNTFVVQEHHATALHWDFRLERDGVLVSWAVPKGLPTDPKRNHLAVQTEDHPLDYGSFEGEIGKGEYGGGKVTIWDRGTYELEKWSDREVKFVLKGERTQGQFVLIHTGGKNWIMHRMGSAPKQDWDQHPKTVAPMLATLGTLPPRKDDNQWAYEMKWDGVRAICTVDGGRITLTSRNDKNLTASYPELRALGASLGTTQVILDGEIVAFDEHGRTNFGLLQQRMHVADAGRARRLAEETPVVYLVFDLLYLDGRSLLTLPYDTRRELLLGLEIDGPNWQTPPAFEGKGDQAVKASLATQMEGVLAKRRTSTYLPGRRSPDWIKVKNIRTQEVVVAGWKPGAGRRAGTIGSLILGMPDEDTKGLRYIGNVGTGFTAEILDDLAKRLARLERKTQPFGQEPPRAAVKDAHWVRPTLVGEVAFSEWTTDGRLRHPSWRGLRPDKQVDDVVPES